MSELNNNQYESWVGLLEKELVKKYRHSRRNLDNDNPVFNLGDIRRKTSEDGFGIGSIDDELLRNTLSQYAQTTNRISINFQKGTFQLTEEGKRRWLN